MPSDPKIIAVRVLYFGRPHVLACDGRCDKAWGLNGRPRAFPDGALKRPDDDDYVLWADGQLGTAPTDPGTYEGFQGKPDPEHKLRSKWCARECERSVMAEIRGGEMPSIRPPDMSVPQYNRDQGRNRYLESEIEWLHPPAHVCPPSMPMSPRVSQSLPPVDQEEDPPDSGDPEFDDAPEALRGCSVCQANVPVRMFPHRDGTGEVMPLTDPRTYALCFVCANTLISENGNSRAKPENRILGALTNMILDAIFTGEDPRDEWGDPE